MIIVCLFVYTDAVKLMKEIGKRFQLVEKKQWDLNQDPCEGNWGTTETGLVSVGCNCPFENDTTCHIDSMYVCI